MQNTSGWRLVISMVIAAKNSQTFWNFLVINPLKHNVEKWPIILSISSGVHTTRFSKYVLLFFNIMPERVNLIAIYFFKVSNKNSRTICETSSKLTIKTLKWRHWRHSDVFIVKFDFTRCSGVFIAEFKQLNTSL